MVWKPDNAGPQNLRELYYWVHKQLRAVGVLLEGVAPGILAHNDTTDRDAPNAHPITAITNLDLVLQIMAVAGYGGIRQDAPVGMANIGAGWSTLPANVATLVNPRSVVQDYANDGVTLNHDGVWQISFIISLEFSESNSGRQTYVRIYNASNAAGGVAVPVPIARNQPGAFISATVMFELDPSDIGDLIQLQIGNGDTIAAVSLEAFAFDVVHVGAYEAVTTLPPPVSTNAVWDAVTAVQVTLTNFDHTALSTGVSNARVEGTVAKVAADTFSLEYTIDAVGDGGGVRCYVGFRSGSSVAPGDADRMWWRGNGQYQMQGDNSAAGAWPTYGTGDILTFVFINGDMWARVNGGAWIGGGDPELATLPSYSGLTGSEIRASFNSDNAGTYPDITINAGDSAFSHMPAAYSAGMQ